MKNKSKMASKGDLKKLEAKDKKEDMSAIKKALAKYSGKNAKK